MVLGLYKGWSATIEKTGLSRGKIFFYKNNNNRQCLQKDLSTQFEGLKCQDRECSELGLKCQPEDAVRSELMRLFSWAYRELNRLNTKWPSCGWLEQGHFE